MKLAAMVCETCGATVDTDDPMWRAAGQEFVHEIREERDFSEEPVTCGRAVLKRSLERNEAIADERLLLASAQGEIDVDRQRQAVDRRRRRTLREIGR